MKRTLLFLILSLVGLTSLAQNPPKPRTVTVHGVATDEIDPERVELFITYRVSDNVKDANKARDQEKSLFDALQKLGIKRENLSVDNLSAYGYGGLSKIYNTNLSLTKVYRLLVDHPAMLDELMPRLVQTGADDVRIGKLESSKLETKQQEVLAKAMNNARQRAHALAQQANNELGSVLSIEEVTPGLALSTEERADKYRRVYRYEMQTNGTDSESLNLRKIRVNSVVEVQYELK